jgi:hypothetical protein
VLRLVSWLQANVPEEDASPPAPAVVHGDFRLDNLVYDEQLQVRGCSYYIVLRTGLLCRSFCECLRVLGRGGLAAAHCA